MNVYVIASAGGMCKIGVTANDPKTRLSGLTTGHPYTLELAACFEVENHRAHDIERRAHMILGSKRMSGEWFGVSVSEAKDAIEKAIGPRGNGLEPGCGNCALSRLKGEDVLQCRAGPPGGANVGWPVVEAEDWCDNHKPFKGGPIDDEDDI